MTSTQNTYSDEELQAYVDNELDASSAKKIEDYLQQHPQLVAEISDYQQQNDDLHRLFDPVLNEPIPPRLLRQDKCATVPRHSWLTLAQAASLFLAIGVGVVAGWVAHSARTTTELSYLRSSDSLVNDAFAFHAVYTPEVLHPVEVGANQQQHLSKWLSKRLKTKIHAPQLAALGFQLLGGRLLASGDEPAAQFMYENTQGNRLTVFARRRFDTEGETAFHYAREGKMNGFYWVDDQLSFVIVSDISKQQVSKVSHFVYQGLNS